ncbi:uncharacterized protein LOC130621422 isoform X2 [Hydractinia symbiolongicarpus]|uniref:uncharacterized protein LOC130621422 isoform X2 n=1 Tax=Hydractinia symbiolongicarpus TaxID=13093 RepID=UPI0025504C94|nr:uncharacterized protein LOC130621422 isoform X2 [Hydractinia symbiolongicarpus]
MMRQYYKARTSLSDMEKPTKTVAHAQAKISPKASEIHIANEVEVVTMENYGEDAEENEITFVKPILHPELSPRRYQGRLDDTIRDEILKGSQLTHATINLAQVIMKQQSGVDGLKTVV